LDPEPLSTEYLEEVSKRCEAATQAPWVAYIEGRDHTSGESFIMRGPLENEVDLDLYLHGATIEDYDFIAHSRQDIPLLLLEIERLRKLIKDCQK